MKRLRKKLKSNRGESIAEVLIALTVTSLAAMVFAGAISASSRIIQQSKAAAATYIAEENELAAPPQETPSENGGLSCEEGSVTLNFGDTTSEITVNIYKTTTTEIYTYEKEDQTEANRE